MARFEVEALKRLGIKRGAELIGLKNKLFGSDSFVVLDEDDTSVQRYDCLIREFLAAETRNSIRRVQGQMG